MLTFYNLKMIIQTEIVISELIVLKTTNEVASSSSFEAAWDINNTDIPVKAAAWRTKEFRMILGNLIIDEIINIKTGNPISLMNKAFFIDIILPFMTERLDFLKKLRRIPTIKRANTIAILDWVQSNDVIFSFHGDDWIIMPQLIL